jgi:hypothetical protein
VLWDSCKANRRLIVWANANFTVARVLSASQESHATLHQNRKEPKTQTCIATGPCWRRRSDWIEGGSNSALLLFRVQPRLN